MRLFLRGDFNIKQKERKAGKDERLVAGKLRLQVDTVDTTLAYEPLYLNSLLLFLFSPRACLCSPQVLATEG